MKLSVLTLLTALCGVTAFQAPARWGTPSVSTTTPLRISTGDDMSEQKSLDISKTVYSQTIKSPKDSYLAFAEKGASNAKMGKMKIFHQAVMGGAYVGFGGLLSFCIAGNIGGIAAENPGIAKMAFASLFPGTLVVKLRMFFVCIISVVRRILFLTHTPLCFLFSEPLVDSYDGWTTLYR